MAKTIRTNNEYQQRIVKMLNSLAGRYSRWVIWQDFIVLAAISIANTIRHPQYEACEKRYLEIAAKYDAAELEVFAGMLGEVTQGLESNPEQDFLGELFMALELGSEWHGQFFTPYNLCQAIAALQITEQTKTQIAANGWVNVNDPACGAGALLIAFANACKAKGINYQQHVLFVAQDIDHLAGMMCFIQLSLLGCAGYIVIDNTLSNPAKSYDSRALLPVDTGNVWYTPMYSINDFWVLRRQLARMNLVLPRKGLIKNEKQKYFL